MTRIGVISDTHGDTAGTRAALAVFLETGCSRLLHCGDIGSPEIATILSVLPCDYVFGNCDGARATLSEAIRATGGTLHDDFGTLEIDGKKIALYHGHSEERLEQEIRSQQWDLLCTGHTHRFAFEQIGPTKILNPGAIKRLWETPGACVVELPKIDVTRFLV